MKSKPARARGGADQIGTLEGNLQPHPADAALDPRLDGCLERGGERLGGLGEGLLVDDDAAVAIHGVGELLRHGTGGGGAEGVVGDRRGDEGRTRADRGGGRERKRRARGDAGSTREGGAEGSGERRVGSDGAE